MHTLLFWNSLLQMENLSCAHSYFQDPSSCQINTLAWTSNFQWWMGSFRCTQIQGPESDFQEEPNVVFEEKRFLHLPIVTQRNRWELPVLRYHSIRGNYHYPFLGVIYSVILHDFIGKNYHKNQSDRYPFPLIMVNYQIFL